MVCSAAGILMRQLLDRGAQLRGDGGARGFVGRYFLVVARRADNQPHFSWPRQTFAFRPGPERAVEITRQHRNVASSYERPDAAFEFLERARSRAGSFGKKQRE